MTLVCSTCSPASSRVRIATLYSCCRLRRFCTPATCWMLHSLSTISTGRKVDDKWCSVMMMMSRFLKQDELHRYVHFALEYPSLMLLLLLPNIDGQDPNHSARGIREWCGGNLFLFFIVLSLCTIARVLLGVDFSTAPTSFAILHPPISLMVHAFFALRSLLALSFVSIF